MKPVVLKISKENAYFQHVESLRRKREKRQKHGEFFVEGVRPINLALKYNWPIKAFLYAPEDRLSDWARAILKHSPAKTHVELTPALLAKLSSKTEPSELLAIVAMPADDLARIPVKERMLVAVFDRPASPGNLGTLIRSCDALQVDGLILSGHGVDLYDPETISASTGSFFALSVVRLPSHKELQPWLAAIKLRVGEVQVIGSDEKGCMALDMCDFSRPTLLVIGNETWGMSAAYRALCDTIVKIPIYGSASSLNVACATSIILYEIDRQRRLL
jgi:tRNA G18 (ribose-2'-O)-methylase SpoU